MALEKAPERNTRIITIASGKGGVGKTNISLNLALSLLGGDRQVCLLDADLGLANIDVLIGLSPEHSLIDFLDNKCSLEELMLTGPGSLKIIPGGTALGKIPQLNDEGKERLTKIFQYLHAFDYLVIDVAAGISEQVLHFFEAASIPILVLVPEPTSLIDAYALLKIHHKRGRQGPVFIIVNQAKSEAHAQKVFNKFLGVTNKFLGISLTFIGHVLADPHVAESVSRQAPFVRLFPESPASLCLRRVAERIFSNNFHKENPEDLRDLLFSPEAMGDHEDSLNLQPAPSDVSKSNGSDSEPGFAGEIVRLFIKEGYLTEQQVLYAKKVQSKLDTPKRLIQVLKDLECLNEEQITATLRKNRSGIRLGSLLLELGYITEKQLTMALSQQQRVKDGKRLGEILLKNNYISEYDLTQVLSMNLGYAYMEPKPEMLDASLMEKTSLQFFQTYNLLPLGKEKDSVQIVMADPLDKSALEAAARLFGSNLSISITMKRFIKESLTAYESLKTHDKRIEGGKSEIVDLVDRLIGDALKKQASDIHIEPLKNRIRVRFRKDGSLIHHSDIPKDMELALVSRIKVMSSANITERRRHQDGRILVDSNGNDEGIDIRVSFYVTLFGEKVVMRILNKKAELYRIKDLGMGGKMLDRFREDVLDLPSGVVIITGPTGAGKTTTLYASINYSNNMETNLITAEEPVEYVIEGIAQCSIDPRIGVTFEETLRHMLRQDPDIIILGEIRDKFSAESAIQAALTGHKVLTTFHTEDSIGGLLRLMNMDIETFLISSTVVCVVAQRLLKKICPHCREDYIPTAKDLRRLKYQPQNTQGYRFQLGRGCPHCDFTGYKGRIGVFEMLVLNEYVKDAILRRKTAYEIRRISIETTGLTTLLEDGIAKAAKGITSIPEIIKHLPLLETPRPLDQINRLIGD